MKKRIPALLLAVMMMLSLCACGSSAKSAALSYDSGAYPAAPAAAMKEAAYDEYYYEPAEEEYNGEFGLSAYGNSTGSTAAAATGASSDAGAINTEKIIYSADARIETTEFDDTVEKLAGLIGQYGGFIESSSVNGNNYNSISRGNKSTRYANYTIRIPSEHFNALMSSLPTLGNVPYSNTYTDNITAQYYDTQARLKAYKTQEQTLLGMLEKAETVEDLIKIEDKLTDVRYSIESVQSTLTNWDRKVSYSTISLSVEEVTVYTPVEEPSFGERVSKAFKSGWEDALEFLQNFFVGLLEALPTLIFLGIIIFIVVFVIVRIRRKAKKRRAARLAKKNAETTAESK